LGKSDFPLFNFLFVTEASCSYSTHGVTAYILPILLLRLVSQNPTGGISCGKSQQQNSVVATTFSTKNTLHTRGENVSVTSHRVKMLQHVA